MTGKSTKITKTQLQNNITKLEKELEEKIKFAEEQSTQLKYMQADFENYRKSLEKEKESNTKLANENLIKELLIILDDFEQAMKSTKDKEGLSLIYKKFFKILEHHGLKKIEALNKKFDPYYHEVLMKEKSDKEDGIILEELQNGYIFNSKIIRHAKVKIAENRGENNG